MKFSRFVVLAAILVLLVSCGKQPAPPPVAPIPVPEREVEETLIAEIDTSVLLPYSLRLFPEDLGIAYGVQTEEVLHLWQILGPRKANRVYR